MPLTNPSAAHPRPWQDSSPAPRTQCTSHTPTSREPTSGTGSHIHHTGAAKGEGRERASAQAGESARRHQFAGWFLGGPNSSQGTGSCSCNRRGGIARPLASHITELTSLPRRQHGCVQQPTPLKREPREQRPNTRRPQQRPASRRRAPRRQQGCPRQPTPLKRDQREQRPNARRPEQRPAS